MNYKNEIRFIKELDTQEDNLDLEAIIESFGQEIKLDELQKYSQRIIDLIDESNKSVEKMGELNNFINKKMNNYESIINQLTENFKFLSESFEQEQKI